MNSDNHHSDTARKIRLPKIPAKYANIVMPFILSVIMTFIVSFVSTVRSIGLSDHLLSMWMGSWGLSWLIAFPTLLVILPLVKKLTQLLVSSS